MKKKTVGVIRHDWSDIENYKAPRVLEVDELTVEFLRENGMGTGYWIGWDRLDTKDKLVWWLHHIVSKPWLTPLHMRKFIEVVCEKNGWERVRP